MCVYCQKTIYVVRDVWNDVLMTAYFHNEPTKNKKQIILKDDIENLFSQHEIILEFNDNLNRENLFKLIKEENKRVGGYNLGIRLELLK